MSPSPRPLEPQLTPEPIPDPALETPDAPEAEEESSPGAAEGADTPRPFGNLTENLTTRWNVETG